MFFKTGILKIFVIFPCHTISGIFQKASFTKTFSCIIFRVILFVEFAEINVQFLAFLKDKIFAKVYTYCSAYGLI